MNTSASIAKNLYSSPSSPGFRFRARRILPFIQLAAHCHERHGSVSVLDVGGKKGYWRILPEGVMERYNMHITILNIPSERREEDEERFTHVYGDACAMPEYHDRQFHILHSNSVIEHVGNWSNVQRFASEVRRVADFLFVQTPYFWFPMEPHYMTPFFHWLPRPWQVGLTRRFTLGNRGKAADLSQAWLNIDEAPRLLDLKSFRLLFPDCRIIKERFLFLFVKSMIAVRGPAA